MSKTRLDAGLDDANLLEPRHTEVAFTMRQCFQTDLEADRPVAITLAEPVIDGSLVSTQVGTSKDTA
jgi:hypothetical protein